VQQQHLLDVDDVLCTSHNPEKSMKRIQDDFKLKDDKMEPPDVYLGASISKMNLASGKTCWTMSPELILLLMKTASRNVTGWSFIGTQVKRSLGICHCLWAMGKSCGRY
jgi:hypothetical protein